MLTVILVSKRLSRPWGTGNFFHKALVKLGHRVVDIAIDSQGSELARLSEIQREHSADLLFVLKGHTMQPGWVSGVNCPTVLWYPDDVMTLPYAAADVQTYGHVYDHVYYFDPAGLPALERLGVKDPRVLLPATDPEVYRRLDIAEKAYDISFVGSMSPERRTFLDRLKRSFNVFEARVFMDEMVGVFNRSKIVFNLGVGKTGYQLRVFEALGMECFLLTNEIPLEFRVLEDGKHLACYNSNNVEGLAAYYLADEAARKSIARCGYEEVVSKHTFDARVQQILGDVL